MVGPVGPAPCFVFSMNISSVQMLVMSDTLHSLKYSI